MKDLEVQDTAKDETRFVVPSELRDVSVARAQDPEAFLARQPATTVKDG
jgi:hypothetical protein